MKASLVINITFVALLTLTVCAQFGPPMEDRYDNWLAQHGRRYTDRREYERRFRIYQTNVLFIDFVNGLNLSFKLTDNKFADMTNDEFRSIYLGFFHRSRNNTLGSEVQADTPSSIDWRDNGAVTPAKNQRQCGSCWAFSAVAAVEGINKIKTGDLVSLSEQQILDCDVDSEDQGCNGGYMEKAFEFIQRNNGVTRESDYPYTGKQGACNRTRSAKRVTISGYRKLPENDEGSLRAAVGQQPVSVAIDAGGYAFQLYSDGVFSGMCGRQLNHGVAAVGYGEDEGGKYWLVKNSWGADWGENGFIRMTRDIRDERGICGIAMDASYPTKD